MQHPMNEERAAKADRLVNNYETDSSLEECLSDLLGDLRHMCDKYGLDFAERNGVGHRNYLAELEEARAAEPAYTVVGRRGVGIPYVKTVYTHNGPEAALDIAHRACAEENEVEDAELEIDAIFAGELELLDFDHPETWTA